MERSGNASAPKESVLAGLFSDALAAERAMAELKDAGFERVEISESDGGRTAPGDEPPSRAPAEPAFFRAHDSTASSFADELAELGFNRYDAHHLVDGLVGGAALVTADAGADAVRAAAIMSRNGADVRYGRSVQPPPATTATTASEQDAAVVKLRAERLAIDKRRVQHGEARIHKEVVTHMESVEVPVSREELVIEQVEFTDDGSGEGTIDAGETIRIPLSEERLHVTKSVESTGEVVIGKRQVRETQHVSETVREERLTVDDRTTPHTNPLPPTTES